MAQKLRFGVMCAGDRLEGAFAASIDELLKIDGVEPALLIVHERPPVCTPLGTRLKKTVSLDGNLWAVFQRLSPLEHLPSCRSRDMSAVFAGVERIHARVERTGESNQSFSPDDVERIRSYDLDFVLRFASGTLSGDILNAARYGIWAFHHGDESKFRGHPAAFWEIYHGEPTTGAILQRLVDRPDAGVVLQRCHIRTREWSYAANLDAIMWASAYMPARVCRDILAGCAWYLDAAPSPTGPRVFAPPSDLQMARFLIKAGSAWVKRQIDGVLFAEKWSVGIAQGSVEAFLRQDFRPPIRWLANGNANTFWADPFVHSTGPDAKRLLLEEFDYAADRGVIVEMDLDENGAVTSSSRPAIDNGLHMSYPYLIEHKGQVYCVPESWQSRGASLYAFDDRERRWRLVRPLIEDFPAVDATVLQHDGLWWLWCTNAEDEPDSKLFLWYALDLLGPWRPHAGNPVKVDVRSSRPAGRPFMVDGTLYRPAQDCSRSYGGSITINRVTRLSPTEFCEEPAAHVEPWDRRYRTGIHTLVGDGSITVVDGKRMVIAPGQVSRRLAHKLRRLGRVFRRRRPLVQEPTTLPARREDTSVTDDGGSPRGGRTSRNGRPPVLLLNDSLIFGGTEGEFTAAALGLLESGWAVHVGCLRVAGPHLPRLEAAGLYPLHCGCGSLRSPRFALAVARLARDLRARRIRLVHTFDFYSNILGVLAARLARVPVVIASQRDLGDLRPPLQQRVLRMVQRLAGYLVVNSEAVAERVKASRTVPAQRIVLIPNGVDLARFAPAPGPRPVRSGRVTVGTLAVLRPEKALGDLVRAAATVRGRCPAARFVIWGEGTCRPELERLVRELGLESVVELPGATVHPERALRDLDIFVLPSVSESCPNAVLEAMATELPVVATRVGGIPALVDDGRTGLLVPPADPALLAQAITRLIEDPVLAATLGARAREKVRSERGRDRMMARIEALYDRALAEVRACGPLEFAGLGPRRPRRAKGEGRARQSPPSEASL